MENLHPGFLVGLLVFLLLCSAFFSSSETGMLSLNRYRLRHQAKEGHRGARRASELLAHPDRLLGTILVGNNFVNTLAFVAMDAMACQQPLEASEQALMKIRFTTPRLEEEQCQHSSEHA